MAFETKDMSGALFVNDKKETDLQPNMTGDVVINGVKYRLAAWRNEGKEGKKAWLSLKASLPQEKEATPQDDDSQIPF